MFIATNQGSKRGPIARVLSCHFDGQVRRALRIENQQQPVFQLVGAVEPAGLSTFRQLRFKRSVCQPRHLYLQALQRYGDVVDGQLHLFMVANIGLCDQFLDFARTDLCQDTQLAIIPFDVKTIAGRRNRRCNFRTVRNSGASGRSSTGYSPAVAPLVYHHFCSLVSHRVTRLGWRPDSASDLVTG
jgi:hypothetical protein